MVVKSGHWNTGI